MVDGKGSGVKVSGPVYVQSAMSWINQQLEDESVFPTKFDSKFHQNAFNVFRMIYHQLFRILSHVYHHHFSEIKKHSLEAHLNTLFEHLNLFGREFNLQERRNWMDGFAKKMEEERLQETRAGKS